MSTWQHLGMLAALGALAWSIGRMVARAQTLRDEIEACRRNCARLSVDVARLRNCARLSVDVARLRRQYEDRDSGVYRGKPS